MILTRKIVVPIVIVLTVFLVGLFVYFFSSLHEAYHEAEERDLNFFASSFSAELENQEQLALTLASGLAVDPELQEALSKKNISAITKLLLRQINRQSNAQINVLEYHIHLADGTVLLKADASGVTAGDGSNASQMALLTFQDMKPNAGLEMEDGVLAIRGIVPVEYEGKHIGSVEVAFGFDETLLANMKEKYQGEWRILILKNIAPTNNSTEVSPDANLMVFAKTTGAVISNDINAYSSAINGITSITHPSAGGRDYAVLSSPLYDYSGKPLGVLDIVYDHTHISDLENQRLIVAGLITIGVLIIGLTALLLLTRRTLQPIQAFTDVAAEITEGKTVSYVNIKSEDDEFGILANAFNRMTAQLRGSIADLEQRVAERTQDLESQTLRLRAAAEISQGSTIRRNIGELLDWSARLLIKRFNYYQVDIYLLDSDRQYASLIASPTEEGAHQLARKHRVRVGDPSSVGRVVATGEPRILPSAGLDVIGITNPQFPESRSELALPLITEAGVIGVLDIHSKESDSFKPTDIPVMQILAEQLATAIERTRLSEESSKAFEELERAYGRFTQEGWQKFASSGHLRSKGYRFNNIRIEPMNGLTKNEAEALATGNSVTSETKTDGNQIAIPIKFRGQTIGVVNTKLREGYAENTITTLEQSIDRLASSLESARLYEEAKIRADREQMISRITSAITSSSDYETVLRTTVREIGNALNDADVAIQITADTPNE